MVECVADIQGTVGADDHTVGAIQPRLGCRATVATCALAAPRHGRDHACLAINAPYRMVLGVHDKEIAVFVTGSALGAVEGRLKRGAAIARVALLARPCDRRDRAFFIYLADAVSLTLDDIDDVFVAAHRARPKNRRLLRRATIARMRPLARSRKDFRSADSHSCTKPVNDTRLYISDIEPLTIGGCRHIMGLLEDELAKP